jgi:sterol desaturase/sphingolipid hydroxylase (fatty acid hydroxylase superfamily)
MDFDTAIVLAFPATYFAFLGLEWAIGGGRDFAKIRFWTLFGVLGLLVSGALSAIVPAVVAPAMTYAHLFDLSRLGLWAALPTVVLTTFFTYWSHRLQHKYDLLWRLGHQLHHAVARVDIGSAMIFHPIDVFVQFVWATLAATLLGVNAEAAGLAGVLGFAIALYQHWNVATPRWVGYIVQRPEAHVLHHEFNVHSRNFGDMPVWDMLFGTYDNPATVNVPVGFEKGRGARVLAMLACIDVNARTGREKV